MPDTASYIVFPVGGSDRPAITAFNMETLGVPNFRSSFHDNCLTWTVQADNIQVAQLINHAGIHEVRKVDSTLATEKRSDIAKFLVVPKDSSNEDQIKETSDFIKSLSNKAPEPHFRTGNGLWFWATAMTRAQIDQVKQHPGVDHVEANTEGEQASVGSPLMAPPPSKVQQARAYATQTAAVRELVAISQPEYVIRLVPDIPTYCKD